MLTRLRFRRNIRLLTRCLADKPEDDGKVAKDPAVAKKSSENATEKIQELLKSMMAEPKISEAEYAQRFVTAPDPRKNRDILETKTEKIEESLTRAATDVAEVIGGNVKQTEAELLSRVLGKINQTSTNLSDLLVGMKVDRRRDGEEPARESRGQHVKRQVERAREPRAWAGEGTRAPQRQGRADEGRRREVSTPISVNIFNAEPLGIFTSKPANHGTRLDMWESLKHRELTLATAQPPANYFEKMILWTEQGKVWKFPINNEQGLEEEQNVHFSEHIFLDAHLEGWCPKKGPVRHFMELVCVGLSKNAFYTVQEKKDHIMWYKEYFESKQDLLTEVGAWDKSNEAST